MDERVYLAEPSSSFARETGEINSRANYSSCVTLQKSVSQEYLLVGFEFSYVRNNKSASAIFDAIEIIDIVYLILILHIALL